MCLHVNWKGTYWAMGLVRLPGTTKIYKVDWDHFRPQNFYMYEGPVVAFMTQGQKGP